MIKILKEGRKIESIFLGECPHCSCKFTCSSEDLDKEQRFQFKYFMKCPCCNISVELEEYEDVVQQETNTSNQQLPLIRDLPLTIRTQNCLRMLNIRTFEELTKYSETELYKNNLGRKTILEIKKTLIKYGLSLK